MLSIAFQNYNEIRELQITGDSGSDMLVYKPTKVDESGKVVEKGTIPPTARVVVEAGSSMPRSLAGKQAFIMELYDKGLFGPQGDKDTNKRVLRLLEMGNSDELFEEEALDRTQADTENRGMKEGITFPVEGYQDHETHLNVHEMYMKTSEFPKLPQSFRDMFKVHREQHQDFITPPAPIGPDGLPIQPMPVGK